MIGRVQNITTELKNISTKGFFHLFTAKGMIILFGFSSQLFIAGILEPAEIGRIQIMQTYIGLASMVCGLGFNASLLKLASENVDETFKFKLYQITIVISVISFVLIYLLMYLANSNGMISKDEIIEKYFPVYALFLLPTVLQEMQLAYYQARKRIKKMANLQIILKVATVALIIINTYYFGLKGFILVTVFSGIVSVIILHKYIDFKPLNRVKITIEEISTLTRRMWGMAGFALMANIVGTISITLDIYLINYLIDDRTEVGHYMFARTIISVYLLFPQSIQQVAFPYFSEQARDLKKWYKSYRKYNAINHYLLFAVAFTGVMILPMIVRVAFAGKYDSSLQYFYLLSTAWFIHSANIIKPTSLMGQGRFDLNFYTSLSSLLFGIPLYYLLITKYGLIGAVYGKITSGGLTYIVSLIIFKVFIKSKKHEL